MSDQDPYTPEQRAAYALMNQAIDALHAAFATEDGRTDVAVDAVLLVGYQNVDEDGDRVGAVSIYPRHGSQPVYITHGLLTRADVLLRD